MRENSVDTARPLGVFRRAEARPGGAQKTWTEARMERAIKLAAEGKSASEIATQLGCSRNAVIGKFHRNQEKARLAGRPGHAQIINLAARMKDRNRLMREALAKGIDDHAAIAARFNVSLAVVRKLSSAMGVTRKQSRRTATDAALRERIRRRKQRLADEGAPPVIGYKAESFQPGYRGQQGRVKLVDLAAHHCRFPIDMPADAKGHIEVRYCGLPKEDGSSYCHEHGARCFTDPTGPAMRKGYGLRDRGLRT